MSLRLNILFIFLLLSQSFSGQESSFEDLRKEYMEQFRINLDSARTIALKMLNLSESDENKDQESTAYKLIGNSYAVQGKFEKANEFFYKSRDILLELNDEKNLATIYSNIGTVFYELGNYTQAQDYLLKSLQLSEKYNDLVSSSRAYNNLGNVHSDLFNNKEALEYYKKALSLKSSWIKKEDYPLRITILDWYTLR